MTRSTRPTFGRHVGIDVRPFDGWQIPPGHSAAAGVGCWILGVE